MGNVLQLCLNVLQSLIRKEFTDEEKKRGRVLVSHAGQEGDSDDDEGDADDEDMANLNMLVRKQYTGV